MTNTIRLPFKRLHPDAKLPVRSTDHAAAYDFFAVEETWLWAGDSVKVPLGISTAVPPGKVLLLFSRSGMGFKLNVSLSNSVGVIDADYRGELVAKLIAPLFYEESGWEKHLIKKGDRVVQGLVIDRYDLEPHWEDELPDPQSNRTGGFGHTGE